MSRSQFARTALSTIIALQLAQAAAASGDAIGPEYRVNQETAGDQGLPYPAMSARGNALTVYFGSSAAGWGIFGRSQYSASGATPASFAVAGPDTTIRHYPAVAMSAGGDAIVAWERWSSTGGPEQAFVRSWNRLDYSTSAEIPVAPNPTVHQRYPQVATDSESNRVAVAWTETRDGGQPAEVHLRLLDSSLQYLGAEQLAGVAWTSFPVFPSLAMNASGRYVVAWTGEDDVPVTAYSRAYARMYQEGVAIGSPVTIGTEVASSPMTGHLAVDLADDGSFVAAWWQDYGIRARRFAGDGTPIGTEVLVSSRNSSSSIARAYPAVALQNDGSFVVAWQASDATTSGADIFARSFASDGSAITTERRINTFVTGDQLMPRIANDADGDALVAWTSAGQDGSGYGAYEIRLRSTNAIDLGVGIRGPAAVQPDEVFSLNVDVANHAVASSAGVGTASGLAVDVSVPSSITLLSTNAPGWSCSAATPLHCDYRDLLDAATSAAPLALTLKAPPSPGSVSVIARVSAHQLDDAAGNDTTWANVSVLDAVPDPFTFVALQDVPRNALQLSAAVVLSGMDGTAAVAVDGGEYSIDGGVFTTAPGSAHAGDAIRLRHVSSNDFAARTDTVLTVGGVSGTFSSTTFARDTVPDAFQFAAAGPVARNALITSGTVTIDGVNDATPISVTGGAYSIDGAAFTTAAGVVHAGQTVRVQHMASSAFATATTTTLTIGGITAGFTSTTGARDQVPDAFAFLAQANAATNSLVVSPLATVAGINDATAIAVTAGDAYSINGGPFTSEPSTVVAGDIVRVRKLSSSSANTSASATLTIGGVSATFTVTTGASDTTPAAFAFSDVTGARRNRVVESNPITIAGYNAPVSITISGNAAKYSISGRAFTAAPGTLRPGETLRLQTVSSPAAFTTTNVIVTVGGASDTWAVQTGSK